MAAALRTVRVTLPRSLWRKLGPLAKAQRRSVASLILHAIKSDLRRVALGLRAREVRPAASLSAARRSAATLRRSRARRKSP